MTAIYVRFPGFKRKAVTLSYDDGTRQDKRLIEIMKRNGLKGTFNLNGGSFSDRLELGAEGKLVYNPTSTDIYLNFYGKQVIAPSGRTVCL